MSSPSKISRLPRPIREQLNQRLEDSESSRSLLKWLNSLPEVQKLLAAEFHGQPINRVNLADWKKNAFRNWQIRRTALEFASDDADDPLAPDPLSGCISQKLAHWVSIRFAALAHTLAPSDEDPAAELRQLNELMEAVVALRRGDFNAERLQLEQKRLALLQKQSEADLEKLFWEWTTRPDIHAKLHPQRDREQVRQEVEKMLNFRLLGIPYDRSQPYTPRQSQTTPAGSNGAAIVQPNVADPYETTDPAILI